MQVEFQALVLRAAIEAVLPAVSTDKERPQMNQICIESGESRSRTAATDGHWACVYEFEAISVETPGRIAISARCARKLLAFLDDEGGGVLLVSDESLCRFEIEGVGRLDERPGPAFPPIEQAWPVGDGARVSSIGMSPALLAKVKRSFGLQKGDGLRFAFFGDGQPVVITHEKNEATKAILMPMRVEEPTERQMSLAGLQ